MTIVQPHPFTLSDAEAAAIQSAQIARQMAAARMHSFLLIGSLLAPAVVVASIFAVDLVWFGGAMPSRLFLTLLAVFVAGMFFMAAGNRLNLLVAKRRLRQTRPVSEPRTVALLPEGVEHAQPTLRHLTLWPGIDAAESHKGVILVWSGHLLVAAVPERAFPSRETADAFLAECRRRAGGVN